MKKDKLQKGEKAFWFWMGALWSMTAVIVALIALTLLSYQ